MVTKMNLKPCTIVSPVNVLIVEENPDLGGVWQRHLERQGATVTLCLNDSDGINHLRDNAVDMIVADLDLAGGGASAVADYAAYRQPDARVVFVTSSSFFSAGAVFANSPNACAFLPAQTEPDDLAAIVHHHGMRAGRK